MSQEEDNNTRTRTGKKEKRGRKEEVKRATWAVTQGCKGQHLRGASTAVMSLPVAAAVRFAVFASSQHCYKQCTCIVSSKEQQLKILMLFNVHQAHWPGRQFLDEMHAQPMQHTGCLTLPKQDG